MSTSILKKPQTRISHNVWKLKHMCLFQAKRKMIKSFFYPFQDCVETQKVDRLIVL